MKLAICIARPNALNGQGIFEKAILDTGTKADWISQMFYDDLRDAGVRSTKLDPEDSEMKYRDFQGKAFKPTGKVDLMIQTEEFKGHIKCRMMKFLVASKATFKIFSSSDYFVPRWAIRGDTAWNGLQGSKVSLRSRAAR